MARSAKETAKDICPTCDKTVGSLGHMCVPRMKGDSKCDWCGSLIPDPRHICKGKLKDLAFICNSCGRTAVQAVNLCKPKKIGK